MVVAVIEAAADSESLDGYSSLTSPMLVQVPRILIMRLATNTELAISTVMAQRQSTATCRAHRQHLLARHRNNGRKLTRFLLEIQLSKPDKAHTSSPIGAKPSTVSRPSGPLKMTPMLADMVATSLSFLCHI